MGKVSYFTSCAIVTVVKLNIFPGINLVVLSVRWANITDVEQRGV